MNHKAEAPDVRYVVELLGKANDGIDRFGVVDAQENRLVSGLYYHQPSAQLRADDMNHECVCCGKRGPFDPKSRMTLGPVHFQCWDEHHSGPTGPWPPNHACKAIALALGEAGGAK